MGVMDRYSEKKKKEKDVPGSKTTSGGVMERYEKNKYYQTLDVDSVDDNYINTFISDTNSFFGSVSDGSISYNDAHSSMEDLSKRYDTIEGWLSKNKSRLDEESYNSLSSTFSGLKIDFDGIKDFYSKWETEDDYNKSVAAAKDYEVKSAADIDTLSKELEHLDLVADEFTTVHYQYMLMGNDPDIYPQEERDAVTAKYNDLVSNYGSYEEFNASRNEKKLFLADAKRIQEGITLSGVADENSELYDPEFTKHSGYVSTEYGDGFSWDKVMNNQYGLGYEDVTYEYINGSENGMRSEILRKAKNYTAYGYQEAADQYKIYDQMTEDEIAIYNYYYAKDGKEAAQKYLDNIQYTLNAREATQMFTAMEDKTLLELAFGVSAGLDQFASGMEGLWNAVTGNDEYTAPSSIQMASGMVREDLADAGPNLPDWLGGATLGQVGYDVVTTTSNMLPSIMTSMAVNAVIPGAGGAVGSALLGSSAGGNAYQEMINLGYDKGQARAYAALVGGSEAILQYALGGISSMSGGGAEGIFQSIAGKWLPYVDNAFARVAIKLGSNMLDEGLEEGLQEILTPWFKNLTLYTNEKVNWSEVAYSSLLGFLTAGFMEGPSTIAGDVNLYKTGKQLQAKDISAQRLAEIGKTFAADTVAYQLADKVNENTGAYTMGRLFAEIGATLTEQNVSEITEALVEKGWSEPVARANAKALAYVVEGGQMPDALVASIESNDVLAEVARATLIDANTTWNQRAKGYNDMLKALADEMTSPKAKQAKQSQENAPVADTVDTQKENGTESLSEDESIDTNPAKVINIADVKKRTIKLEDGSEVNVKDADLSPEDGVRIETIVSIDGISTEDANFILNTLRSNTGASAQMDSLGAKEAFKYGFYGFSQDHMTKHGVFANSLTESQRQAIYDAGKKARQKQIESASPKTTTKERGVYFDHGNGNIVAFKDADKRNLTEGKRRAGVQAALILHKLGIGGDIYFFESYRNAKGKLVYKDANGIEKKAPNGWYSESDGSIHIDLNAGVKGDGLVLFTLAHELTHFIEKWSPQKYKILADFLVENYEKGHSMDQLIRAKQAQLSETRKEKVSYDEAYSEVIADSMEAMLADGNVMEKILELKAKDEGLVAKIKQFFENLLVKIRNAYEGLTPDSAQGQAVLEMTDSIEKVQQLFAEALVEASDNFQTAQAQFSTDSLRGNADGAVAQSEVTTALVETTDGEILTSERTEYEALPKQMMSLSDGSGKLLSFIEGLIPTKLKGLSGRTTNGYTGRGVRAYAMGISGFTDAQIQKVNEFMDAMSEFMDKAGVTYKFIGLQDVKDAKLHYTYNADGSIKSIVLSAMVKNGDYPVNFDLSSICKKRVAMSKLIDKLAKRGSLDSGTVKLTPSNIFKINTALKNEGYETACLGCFVESKRYNSLEWAKTFCNKWNAAVKKVNPNATYFGYGDGTFNEDSFTLEQAVKIDEAATKYLTTTKVERMANALKKYKAREQAGLPLVEKFSDAAKKRLVKSETISDELKDKYLNIDVTTLTMADVEFLLENEVLPGASLSNKQAVTEMVKSGEAYQHLLRPSDLLTDRGISKLEALPNFHGVLYGHYGSGTPKLMQSYTPYNSEIALLPANKNNDQTLAEYLYTIAGVRMQSFSDFQIQNIYDYLQMVADLAARKLPAHAYTKEISFAKLLGMTGIKVNLSVMFDIDPMVDKAHAGLTKLNKLVHRGEYARVVLEDEQGKWVYNIGDYQTQKLFAEAFPDEAKRFLQSIGFGDAVKLQSTPGYSANCGIIGVGYSDLGIFAMLDDNRIRYIIPYHASSLPAEIKLATNIALGTDYTSYQNNMKIAGIVDKNGNAVNWSIKEAYKRLGSGQAVINELNEKVRTEGWVVTTKKAQTGHGTYGLYEDLQQTNNPRQTAGNFMDWCIGNGTLPLFYQFASHENYYKLLYDFNVYDCVTEEYAPQQAVTNTYPTMVDGQVQPGNVTDGGFDAEYLQGTIDKQMAFMDEYSRNLDEDLEEMADNLEAGTKMSDRYSPEVLFAKDPLAVATFPVKAVPAKRKKVNLPEIVKEAKKGTGSIVYAVNKEKPTIQRYVHISDIDSNVLVNTRGITHGAKGNITNSSSMSTAEVERVLPDVLRNSIAVNEMSPRDEDIANGVVKSYILFGYAKRADGKEYLVRSIINHFEGNKSMASSITIYDVLKGMKAKKMDSEVIGSHTGNPAASHLNTTKPNFTISVKDLLDIVKENYPELLSDNFREYYGVTVPKADNLLFSDRDTMSDRAKEILASAKPKWIGKNEKADIEWDTVRELFNELNADKDIQALADRVFKVAKDDHYGYYGYAYYGEQKSHIRLPMAFVGKSGIPNGVAGQFRKDTIWGDIIFNYEYFMDESVDPQKKASTILHEVIHAITTSHIENAYRWMQAKYGMFVDPLTITDFDGVDDRIKAGIELIYAFEQVRSAQTKDGKNLYGQLTAYEMVAEMANVEFRNFLKKQNLWDRIVDAIKRIFGIPNTTAYDAVSEALERILTETTNDADTQRAKIEARKENNRYSDRILMGSLFSGGGTLEAGLAYQMLDKQFGVEYDGKIASVYADNHGDHIQVGRVEDFDISKFNDIFYLHASPVCHNFSNAKHGAKELQMDINSAKATAKHLETAMPQVFTVENAPGYRKSQSLKIITDKLTELGYKWDVDVYNSADYGSATSRNRVILRAVKDGELPAKPTKQERTNSWDKVTRDLWDTLPKATLRPSFISAIENTRNLPILDANGKVNVNKPLLILTTTSGHTVTYCWEGDICPTLTTKCGEARLVMPDGSIYAVTPEFMGRIQGLPNDYKYPNEKTRAFTIIGNGIPTHLTKAVVGGVLDSAYEQTHDGQVLYQDRDTESVSNRSLLANAFEGLAQNDIEKNKIQEYKGKIELINAEEKKLSELNQQIKELSFAKGPRDTKKIRSLQFEANQTANRINTYDKQLLRLEASKPLQDVLAREKKLAYQKAEKRGKEALDKYKERAAKTQRALLEKWQDSRKKGIESREKTAMRHKVQNVVKELNDLLLSNDKKRHVPDSLKKAVADALALVNMDTVGAEERAAKYAALIAKETDPDKIDAYTVTMENILKQGEKMGQKLKELRDAYEEIQNSDDPDIANAYDPVIAECLKELAGSIGNTSLKDMSIEQLQDVYSMYKMVLTRVRDANKSFLNDKKETISSLASRVVGEVRRVGGEHKYRAAVLDFVKKFGWDNLKPVYAFEHIGSGTLTDVFNSVRAGEDVWAVDVTEAREYYLDKSKKYGYDSWDFKKKYRFQSASELEFDLTLEQILSLYAYSKREQAHDHLRLGGFVFDSNIETYKENGSKLIKYKVNTADAHQLTPEILANIIGNLTEEQKSFVDDMQEYLSTVMGAKGNEVTMAMYGVKLFKEKAYFPLKSAKQFMFEQNEVSGEVRIKNSGFTNKVVAKANNPVILSNFMDVWANHVNDMSMYHAFVLPLEDFNRVFNYNSQKQEGQPPVSVKGTIQNAYGPSAVGYVRQLITDLNGGARTDSTTGFINKMMGLFKKGSVFASLSVTIQQPSAIARAAALVDTKYFIGPKVDHKRHKALWAEVKQYAPVAIIKEMGYFDTNMGKSTQDFILAKEYSGFKEKMKALATDSGYRDEVLSKAPALADELAWCSIWEAVKRETMANNPGMDVKSEAFLKMAGERFTEVIVKTQVYDSVLSRSGMMRSKDTGMKMATAFMAEPTTSINMIADALLQGKRGNRKYCRTAIGAVIASQILNSILVSFVYAGRDDEDEEYMDKYLGTLAEEVLDSLNPATYIPFIKDIVSIVKGYDVERSDMAVISDLWKAVENLSSDKISAYRKVENFAGSIAQIFGLPVKNIMRDLRAIYQTIVGK